jgi:predicted ester cyclase
VTIDGERRPRDDYAANLRGWIEAFPDFRWELRHLLVDGDWIAAHFLASGTHRGTFRGVAATGRGVTVRELALYRIEDGRIAEVWGTVDELGVLEQIR